MAKRNNDLLLFGLVLSYFVKIPVAAIFYISKDYQASATVLLLTTVFEVYALYVLNRKK